MWWAAAKSTPRLNATWNLQNKSGKITIMLQNLRKRSCKTETKELQYSYRKGDALLDHEIFFFLFLEYRVSAILLRLFSFTAIIHAPHRQCPASCAKGLVRCFGRAFLHSASPVLPAKVILQKSKYDQCPKTLGNLSVFPQRTIIKFGAAGVCILAGFVVKYIQSIPKSKT